MSRKTVIFSVSTKPEVRDWLDLLALEREVNRSEIINAIFKYACTDKKFIAKVKHEFDWAKQA